MVWEDRRLQIWDADGVLRWESADCDVRLDEAEIVVSYFDEEGPVVLVGSNDRSGRFLLRARSRVLRATLELSSDGSLEGAWETQGTEGTWRIELEASA